MWASSHLLSYSRAVPSSDGKTTYIVAWGPSRYENAADTGQFDWSCTCPDWTHRHSKHGGTCKHINAVSALTPEQGGMCDWQETEDEPAVYLKQRDGSMKAFAPCRDEHNRFIEATWFADDPTLVYGFHRKLDNGVEEEIFVIYVDELPPDYKTGLWNAKLISRKLRGEPVEVVQEEPVIARKAPPAPVKV